MKIIGQITQWSFSRWWDWSTCPLKAYYKHVMKIKEPGNQAMQRGTDIGRLGEDFLNGKLKRSPAEFEVFAKDLAEMKKLKAVPEGQWAFTEKWEPVDWFAKNAWVRIKIDAFYFLLKNRKSASIDDFKTGKPKDHHQLQLSLYGIGAFEKYPELEEARTRLLYLDHPQKNGANPTLEIYTRDELPKMKKAWLKRVKPMLADETFKAKPGHDCRFCFFRKSNRGPCAHG